MGKSLMEKAGRIQLPPTKSVMTDPQIEVPATSSTPVQSPVSAPKPRTAPGTLMGFMANQSEAMKENSQLREQVTRFEGASPTRLLDSKTVVASVWANRDLTSFTSPDFSALKGEIAAAGGNVQPIKVRPITKSVSEGKGVGPSYPPGALYEIVFGHRRHQACLELELPVLALIEQTSDQELFMQMERENRNRADLSAWEQGVMYARALDRGLYASNRQLAAAIGRDLSDIGRALALARLPAEVVKAFKSPLELQFRWAKPLNDALQADPDGLIGRAKKLAGQNLKAKQIFELLLASEGLGLSYPLVTELKKNGKLLGTLTESTVGQITIRITASVDTKMKARLQQMIEGLF